MLTATTVSTAQAGEPELPILDDPSSERLYPDPGALKDLNKGPATVVKKVEDPKPEEAEDAQLAVGVHGRLAAFPDFYFGLFMDRHPGTRLGGGGGISIEYGPPKSWQVVLEIDWLKIGMPSAFNYAEIGVPAQAATYAEIDWHFISVDISYQGHVGIVDGLTFIYRLGAGLGGFAGSATKSEVLPNCTAENLANCGHWRRATQSDIESPLPVIPVVHVAVGFSIDLGDIARLRIQGGFRDILYGGLGVVFNL